MPLVDMLTSMKYLMILNSRFVRFVDVNTIFLAQVPEDDLQHAQAINDEIVLITHKNMEENFEILKQARNLQNEPFKIVRIPTPVPMFDEFVMEDASYEYLADSTKTEPDHFDIVLPASYLNFIIANEIVMIPKYYKEGRAKQILERDTQVLQLFEAAFPTRKVVQLEYVENVNFGGGGMHCITQQMPANK